MTPTIIGGLKESEPLPALGPLYSCPNSTAFISPFHTAEVKAQKFEFMKCSHELRALNPMFPLMASLVLETGFEN